MQARKDEILAKKAKLAELKRQRELRQKEFTQNRASIGDASEVNTLSCLQRARLVAKRVLLSDSFACAESNRQQSRARQPDFTTGRPAVLNFIQRRR